MLQYVGHRDRKVQFLASQTVLRICAFSSVLEDELTAALIAIEKGLTVGSSQYKEKIGWNLGNLLEKKKEAIPRNLELLLGIGIALADSDKDAVAVGGLRILALILRTERPTQLLAQQRMELFWDVLRKIVRSECAEKSSRFLCQSCFALAGFQFLCKSSNFWKESRENLCTFLLLCLTRGIEIRNWKLVKSSSSLIASLHPYMGGAQSQVVPVVSEAVSSVLEDESEVQVLGDTAEKREALDQCISTLLQWTEGPTTPTAALSHHVDSKIKRPVSDNLEAEAFL